MLEKIFTYALIIYVVWVAYVCIGGLHQAHTLGRKLVLTIGVQELTAGVFTVILVSIVLLLARWADWTFFIRTALILAVPYTLLMMILSANRLDGRQIRKDTETLLDE